jgi:hypothetical protein
MQKNNNWILEITFQDNHLGMSLYERERELPLKTISTVPFDFSRIERLNNEIVNIINRTSRKNLLDEDSIVELKKNAGLLYDMLLSRQIKSRLSSLETVNPALSTTERFSEERKGGVNLILSLDESLIGIPWELLFDFLTAKISFALSLIWAGASIPRNRKFSHDTGVFRQNQKC